MPILHSIIILSGYLLHEISSIWFSYDDMNFHIMIILVGIAVSLRFSGKGIHICRREWWKEFGGREGWGGWVVQY